MVAVAKGARLALSLTGWLATVPLMVGGVLTAVSTTVVVLLLTGLAMPSLAVMVKVVVTVLPSGTWWGVGANTSWWMAVVAWLARPRKW